MTERDDGPGLRVALIATPRSGNTWLRELLAPLLGLEPLTAHTPDDVPWSALPGRCVLQLHWPYDRDVVERLADARFQVVVLARHPLDVLISILNFARRAEETGSWLAGEEGDEEAIRGAGPLDQRFLEYATGPRAAALLGVTPSWWPSEAVQVRYEDLVADPEAQLRHIAGRLGEEPRRSVDEVVRGATVVALRTRHLARHFHFWQASPGLWRSLLPADIAQTIADAHPETFRTLGYACDPDPQLSAHQADVRWLTLQVNGLAQQLTDTEAQLGSAWHLIAEQSARFDAALEALAGEARDARGCADAACDALDGLEGWLYPLLGVARRLRQGLLWLDSLGLPSAPRHRRQPG